jgi:hypothetical protein
VDLEETLEKVVELAREELRVVRKRAQEKTPARDHGKDYHEAHRRPPTAWTTTPISFTGYTTPSIPAAGGTTAPAT